MPASRAVASLVFESTRVAAEQPFTRFTLRSRTAILLLDSDPGLIRLRILGGFFNKSTTSLLSVQRVMSIMFRTNMIGILISTHEQQCIVCHYCNKRINHLY